MGTQILWAEGEGERPPPKESLSLFPWFPHLFAMK